MAGEALLRRLANNCTPDELLEAFQERAGIMQFDAADAYPTREAAEAAAWCDTLQQALTRHGESLPAGLSPAAVQAGREWNLGVDRI